MTPTKQPLRKVIRAAREAAGVSQERLANLSDTTLTTISEIELGKRNPGWSIVARIMNALNLHGEDIAGAIEYEYEIWEKK